jgi:hypothetical protein
VMYWARRSVGFRCNRNRPQRRSPRATCFSRCPRRVPRGAPRRRTRSCCCG